MIDIAQDLAMILEGDFAVDCTAYPDTEQAADFRGLFNDPAELADMGGEVGFIKIKPTLRALTGKVGGLVEDDPVRVMPCAILGVAGGDYLVKQNLPTGNGGSILELKAS